MYAICIEEKSLDLSILIVMLSSCFSFTCQLPIYLATERCHFECNFEFSSLIYISAQVLLNLGPGPSKLGPSIALILAYFTCSCSYNITTL